MPLIPILPTDEPDDHNNSVLKAQLFPHLRLRNMQDSTHRTKPPRNPLLGLLHNYPGAMAPTAASWSSQW